MIVLDQSFSILNYPELSSLRYYSRPGRSSIHPGVKRCAAFSPTGEEVIVGQHNGQVIQYSELGKETGARRQLVANLANDVVAVRFLPGQPYFILAESGGEIQIRGWPALEVIKRLEVPTRLTSLDLSGDGAFFAVGTNQAELTLWDLRVLKLPDLMQAPLGKITAGQFAEILSFLEPSLIETTQLPTPVRNTLKLLRTLLQYRYRYDINVEELPVLRAGEFDILIEG
jgi:WD40 repeat protein